MARAAIMTRPWRRRRPPAGAEMVVSMVLGTLVAVPGVLITSPAHAVLVGWDVATVVYMTWVWLSIARQDNARTAELARSADPSPTIADLLLVSAALASLIAVGSVLARSGSVRGLVLLGNVGLAVISLLLSWALVHTLFTLHYARLYYYGEAGGIDFGETGRPDYRDFAYLAFTIGMTFQVSDTPLQSREIRRTALRHALLSYVFGTGILATAINLVASLTSR